ncbi:MAG TPA: hypothetical protein VL096_14015 [Pirellulaceae bacterium]|nr:hypothetical protein [Pirellulaceae bacterium]
MPAENSPPPAIPILQQLLLGLSLVAYLFALILPAVQKNPPLLGFETLGMFFIPPWWANPLLLAAWICGFCQRPLLTLVFSVSALPLAAMAPFMLDSHWVGLGYVLWVLSIVLASLTGLSLLLQPQWHSREQV